ncbi:MAG: hypothetical protein FWG38_01915 [Defluviitaleaceae bacterium]|nr:hypothetical protein [Defluviitaleaceae bacterium]
MKKRTIALLIMLAAVAALALTGCDREGAAAGGDGTAARELADSLGLPHSGMEDMPFVEFTVFIRDPETPPAADNPIIQIVEEITNVRLNFEYLVGDLDTRMGIMIASGDYPDAIFVGGETGRFIEAEALLPLQDLIPANAPNLRRHYDQWWNRMYHGRDNIYIMDIFGTHFGQHVVLETWDSAFWLQKSVLDHFGRPPADIHEFFDFIRQYMALNPTIDGVPTIGFEVLTDGWRRFCIDNPPMFMQGYANWGPALPGPNQTALDRWNHPWTREYYYLLNQEFHNGTIPLETLTRTFDQYIATIASGAVLGLFDQKWNFNAAQTALIAEGRYERTYLPLALTWPGATPNYMGIPTWTGNNGLGITISNHDPERFLQYIDWIIQEPVQRFLAWGIEGEHWFFNGEGRMERFPETRANMQDARWSVDNLGTRLRDHLPKIQGRFSDGNASSPGDQPEEYFANLRDYDRELFARLGILTEAGFMGEPQPRPVYYPFWSMNWEDGSPAQMASQRLDDVNASFLSRLVIAPAGEFDALWAEYQAALAGTGYQDLLDEIERQIQVRIAAAE